MAETKTKLTDLSVDDFINTLDEKKRRDCESIIKLMKQVSKSEPRMWGASIIGFGQHHYVYANGRKADWFLTGFSPRKQNLALYIMGGFEENTTLLKQLGRYKTGKSCLYIKTVDDINLDILKTLIKQSIEQVKAQYK